MPRKTKNSRSIGVDTGIMPEISSHLLKMSGNRQDWRRALVDSGFSSGADLR